jgi:pimeloyl-ACP methyl ester carboxylesterase
MGNSTARSTHYTEKKNLACLIFYLTRRITSSSFVFANENMDHERRFFMTIFWISLKIILIGIVLVSLTVVLVRYFKEINAARERLKKLGSQVVETDCGPIEYAKIGDGYPVLVVHGAMGGFDQGLWLAKSFNITNHQVISVSRFGYLRSPIPDNADLNKQADAFAGLLDALGIQRAAVFGVSAGSTSAIRFTARYPDRVSALILLGPDAPGEIQMSIPPRFMFDTVLRSDFIYWALFTFFGKSMQKAIGLAPEGLVLTPEYEAMVRMIQLGDLPVSQRMDGMIFESYTSIPEFVESVTPVSPYPLDKIQAPVLVINAADDPISIPVNVLRLAEQMPNMHLMVVPEGGHFLFGYTEEVQSEIAQFLRSNVPELQSTR